MEMSSRGGDAGARGRGQRSLPRAPATPDAARVAALCAPVTDFEAGLLAAVRAAAPSLPLGGTGARRARALADALSAAGYLVTLRERLRDAGRPLAPAGPGGHTAAVAAGRGGAGGRGGAAAGGRRCLENLSHTYPVVTGSLDTAVVTEAVVEPDLASHFVIAQPTPAYAALLACLPPAFVGSPARLAALVDVLAAAAATAFEEQGLPLPPWRRARSLLSKWGLPEPAAAAARAAARAPAMGNGNGGAQAAAAAATTTASTAARPASAKRDARAAPAASGKRRVVSLDASPPLPSLPNSLAAYGTGVVGGGGGGDAAADAANNRALVPPPPPTPAAPPPAAAAAHDARRVSLLAKGLSRLSPTGSSAGSGGGSAGSAAARAPQPRQLQAVVRLPSLGDLPGLARVKSVRPRGGGGGGVA